MRNQDTRHHGGPHGEGVDPPPSVEDPHLSYVSLPQSVQSTSLSFNLTAAPRCLEGLLPEIRSAIKDLFPGQQIVIPEQPLANGGLGAVFRITVGEEVLKLKVIGTNCLDDIVSDAALPQGATMRKDHLISLDPEHEILRRGSRNLPELRGVVFDKEHPTAPRSVVALLTEWVDGRFFKELLADGTLTADEAKALALTTIEELRAEGIRILDSDPSNYCITDSHFGFIARYIDAGMCRSEACPDDPVAQKRWYYLAQGVLPAIDMLVPRGGRFSSEEKREAS